MAKQVCSHPAQVLGWQLLLLSKLWLGRWLGFPGAGSQSRGKLSHSPQKGSFLLDLPPELHIVLKAAHLPACLPAPLLIILGEGAVSEGELGFFCRLEATIALSPRP